MTRRSAHQLSPFDRLDPDKRRFALLFLRAAGNLREMERLLGVSYPTVRKKLDEVIAVLGGPVTAADPPAAGAFSRQQILELVRQGRLSADEALARLQALEEGS